MKPKDITIYSSLLVLAAALAAPALLPGGGEMQAAYAHHNNATFVVTADPVRVEEGQTVTITVNATLTHGSSSQNGIVYKPPHCRGDTNNDYIIEALLCDSGGEAPWIPRFTANGQSHIHTMNLT